MREDRRRTKARAPFQRALSPFFSTKQCVTMRGKQREPLWGGNRQNGVEAAARSGRGDETKRDERERSSLWRLFFSHSAMKDTGEESSGRLPAVEQSRPYAAATPLIQTRSGSIVGAVAPYIRQVLNGRDAITTSACIRSISHLHNPYIHTPACVFSGSLRRRLIFFFFLKGSFLK